MHDTVRLLLLILLPLFHFLRLFLLALHTGIRLGLNRFHVSEIDTAYHTDSHLQVWIGYMYQR